MMRRKLLPLVLAAACLVLTGCGYSKPEIHSMMGLNINSITTVCGTDCTIDDIDVNTVDEHVAATYVYTNVAGGNGITDAGIRDARKYHEYLSSLSSCVKIDDFDEEKGSYNAYFRVSDKINEGFLMKVSFTKDTYTVHIEDNANLEEV